MYKLVLRGSLWPIYQKNGILFAQVKEKERHESLYHPPPSAIVYGFPPL